MPDSNADIARRSLLQGVSVSEIKRVLSSIPGIKNVDAIISDVTRNKTLNVTGVTSESEGSRKWTAEIREWAQTTSGYFSTATCDRELNILSKDNKAKRRVVFSRLVEEGLLQRHPSRDGIFRRIDTETIKMDLSQPISEGANINLPLGLNDLVRVYPGNIIVVAGEKDSGKTAFCLNAVADNLTMQEIHYFNCEMGSEELTLRLREFDNVDMKDFEKYANFYERSDNFADAIIPGKGILNIVDYMAIYENHYLIGQWIDDIHKKLDGAIAIIAIQKPAGRDMGIGGTVTLDKPRLYIAMSKGKAKIVSAKNRKDKTINPNGMIVNFKLIAGFKFINTDRWSLPEEE